MVDKMNAPTHCFLFVMILNLFYIEYLVLFLIRLEGHKFGCTRFGQICCLVSTFFFFSVGNNDSILPLMIE